MASKFVVRLTRREIITIESMLREHAADGDSYFTNIAEGFKEEIGEMDDLKPFKPLSAKEAVGLADRLCGVEQGY